MCTACVSRPGLPVVGGHSYCRGFFVDRKAFCSSFFFDGSNCLMLQLDFSNARLDLLVLQTNGAVVRVP